MAVRPDPHEISAMIEPMTVPVIPPGAIQPGMEKLDSPANLSEDTIFPVPDFAKAKMDKRKRTMPQIIAHRGYRAKFPENSLLAFSEAIKGGAMALETDIHLTKDNVVVLSHDANLKRCFGRKDKIVDCTWDEIKDLRTLASPHVHMPRLQDLLQYLLEPGMEEIWLLLDIKLDNNTDDVMRLIGSTIESIPALPGKPWNKRILLGLWAAKYLSPTSKFLPGFSAVHIGLNLSYAKQFFGTPYVGFNILMPVLLTPLGKRFTQKCRRKDRQIIAWTVNDKDKAEWCVRRGLDGVITDDPRFLTKTWEDFDEHAKEPLVPVTFGACFDILWVNIVVTCLFWWFRKKFFSPDGPIKSVPSRK